MTDYVLVTPESLATALEATLTILACEEYSDAELAAAILAAHPREATDALFAVVDQAIWGFAGEPRRCSRCGHDEGDEHSPTCPMPDLLARLPAALREHIAQEGGS